MHKERDPRVVAVAEKLAAAQPYGFEYVKSGPSAADYHAAIIAVKTLDSLAPQEISYDEIKAGDIIRCDYPGGFSVGIALEKKRVYEDEPDSSETIWKMDGMEYLGQSIGSWHEAGILTRIHEREVSPLDEKAKGWLRAEQEEREKNA